MNIKFHDFKYYIEECTDEEWNKVRSILSWFQRAGTLKDLKPGDWVKVKGKPYPGTYAQVKEIKDKQISVKWLDGREHTYLMFNLEPQAKISLIMKDDQGVFFYYGLLRLLRKSTDLQFVVENEYNGLVDQHKIDPKILPGIELYDFQQAAVNKSLTLKRGLNIMPTNSGKSECILALLRELLDTGKLTRGLVLVPTVNLSVQLAERAYKYGFTKEEIGELHAGAKDFDSKIIAAVVDSVAMAMKNKKSQVMDFLQEMNVMIIDESHHVRSDTQSRILFENNHVDYMLGFSGSPFLYEDPLQDAGDSLVYGITGGPIFTMGYDILINRGLAAKPIIHFKGIGGKAMMSRQHFNTIYTKNIVENQDRNKAVVEYIQRFHKFGYQVLILGQRVEHIEKIMHEVAELEPIFIAGGAKGVYYSDMCERVEFKVDYTRVQKQIAEKKWKVIFGTTVMDEGVDMPSIGAVIMMGGGKSRIKVLQRLGRGLRRKLTGVNQVFILDFQDRTHAFLNAHSNARAKLYNLACADVISDEQIFNRKIYEGSDSNG